MAERIDSRTLTGQIDTLEATTRAVRRKLFGWGRDHFRPFVWRSDRDLYRLLVTEVLLKQTTALQVSRMRDAFLADFPTSDALAAASEAEIFDAVAELGLGRQRATQLKQLGVALVETARPRTLHELHALPGVGEYAASAVACFGWGHRAPALDVNVARIVARLYGIEVDRGEERRSRIVRARASTLLQGARPRELNWALLDLGAEICRPRPRCAMCPIRPECAAGQTPSRGNDSGQPGGKS